MTQALRGIATTQQAQSDEQFYAQLGQQLTDGSIDQSVYTRKIAERTAQRTAAQLQPATPATPQTPQPDPAEARRQAQQIGARAILSGLGLQGTEPGLDFTSPQALLSSGQAVLASRTPAQAPATTTTTGGRDVNAEMAELARQQGFVIPHRDGGTPASAAQPVGEQDLHQITTNKRYTHAPRLMTAALQAARDSIAAKVGTVQTGEGLLGSPSNFRAQ